MATVTTSAVKVRAAANADELHRANALMAASHRRPFEESLNWFETTGATYPGFLPAEHTRVAWIDGSLAGALRLTTEVIRIGDARLKMGGLGWVSTAVEHRHKGVASALVRATVQYMAAHGYHVSMLFGIPNFYHRFGYTTTLAEYYVTLDAEEASRASTQYVLARAIKPGDIAAVQRIHNTNDSGVACSLLRSAAHLTNKWHLLRDAEVLTNLQGRVLAYAIGKPDADGYLVTEAGIDSPQAAPALIAHCARRATEAHLAKLRFAVPPAHDLARTLREYESTHEARLSRERGGMMTVIDAGETLESLLPEWETLLAGTSVASLRTEVTLLVGPEGFRIRANRGALDVSAGSGANKVSLTPQELVHLATGYLHVDDVLRRKRRILTGDGRALLVAIFPKRDPYVHLLDRF